MDFRSVKTCCQLKCYDIIDCGRQKSFFLGFSELQSKNDKDNFLENSYPHTSKSFFSQMQQEATVVQFCSFIANALKVKIIYGTSFQCGVTLIMYVTGILVCMGNS
uniref:Uncharacterized protein n=1 Tax=Cacopsylla melanoneura TaxID=428564 RepID=A0A8D9EM50_9HEMI